jgi:CheY-like chemotaxis protein
MKKKRVLIIDDDSRNIFAMRATLKSKSFDCVSFLDAQEALDYLRGAEDIDAILLDMMMPDLDGYEMIPLIKALENRRKTPVVAVTAQAMVGDKERCLRAGADDYISKPVDVDKLMTILSRLS